MEGPYLTRRAYMYGRTFFDQEVPQYAAVKHHNLPLRTDKKPYYPYDDGMDYQIDESPEGILTKEEIEALGLKSITELESRIKKTLVITIYGSSKEEDKTVELIENKKYSIVYITRFGMKKIEGKFRFISTSTPELSTKYINQDAASFAQSYIGIDCSKEGESDKRVIYINTIRDIKLIEEITIPQIAPGEGTNSKLEEILKSITEIKESVTKANHNIDKLKEDSLFI